MTHTPTPLAYDLAAQLVAELHALAPQLTPWEREAGARAWRAYQLGELADMATELAQVPGLSPELADGLELWLLSLGVDLS